MAKVLNLLVASPGDVANERDAVERVCQRVQKSRAQFAIKVHRWEDGPPSVGGSAQEQVERFIPKYGEIDIVVIILWHRYGTKLANGVSGTEHEFNEALRAKDASGNHHKPEIIAYNCTLGVSINDIDHSQIVDLRSFVERIKSRGLLKSYASRDDFERTFEDHLHRVIDVIGAEEPKKSRGHTQRTVESTGLDALVARVKEAEARIRKHIYRTPLVRSKRLESDLGCRRVMLKLDCVQITGSFKVRGAMNALLSRLKAGKTRFATASAGNHALGLAYSVSRHGGQVRVYVPERTPLTKRLAIERYTNDIVLVGASFEETKAYALKDAATLGYEFIHPYDDLDVMAGQGTIGLELIDDVRQYSEDVPPDIVVIPVGGGGLIAGVGAVVKKKWPEAKVIGAEAAAFPSLDNALRSGCPSPIQLGPTFADGIAVAQIGDKPFSAIKECGLVDEVWKVTESSMAKAVIRIAEDARVIAEGAGACALGGLFDRFHSDPKSINGKNVLLLISGGNLDTIALTKILQRGLVLSSRIAHLNFEAPDVPGALATITRDIADLQVNILDLWHGRLSARPAVGRTAVHVLIEARDAQHVDGVLEALRGRGHKVDLERD